MCLQLDTGNSSIGEIEAAVDVIRAAGNENIIIHHCPSGYPAHLESINLNVIPTLKRMFPYPIAYSDHTPGWEMDVAALALGANLIEKSITEDRMTRSHRAHLLARARRHGRLHPHRARGGDGDGHVAPHPASGGARAAQARRGAASRALPTSRPGTS